MSAPNDAWETIYRTRGKVFTDPHEDMARILGILKVRGAQTVLDLGCGSGRHVAFFARHGYSVFGLDHAPSGIELTRQWLAEEGLTATLQVHDLADLLPFEPACFDAVISTQVIHHATLTAIRGIVGEIERVLKPGGLAFVTVPRLKNQGTEFEQIEPNTFVPLDGPEKGLPHHYFTPEELRDVFGRFTVLDIHLDGVNHYCLSAVKPG